MDDAIMGDKLDSETLNLLTYVTMDRDLDPKRIVEAGYIWPGRTPMTR
jgi:hypothetical protein